MLQQIFNPKGLDLRRNKITRDPNFARDMRNIEKNSNNEFKKRRGYTSALTVAESNILDLMRYDNDSLMVLKSDDLKILNGSTLDSVPYAGDSANTPIAFGERGDFIEYNRVLYWTDPSGTMPLWKYDGYSHYRAGLPEPVATISNGGSGSFFFRLIYQFTDLQGNILYSAFKQFGTVNEDGSGNVTYGNAPSITITGVAQTRFTEGHYNRFGEVSGGPQTINSGNLTLTVDFDHNYQDGDWIQTADDDTGELKPVRIATANTAGSGTTTLVFDGTSFTHDFTLQNLSAVEPYRWRILIARSPNFASGYVITSDISDVLSRTNNASDILINLSGGLQLEAGNPVFLRSFYDDTQIRIDPPRCKHLGLFNNYLVLGNDVRRTTTDDTRGNPESAIFWSDSPDDVLAATVETFFVDNRRVISDSNDGSINGLFGDDDNLVVMKQRQIFYINGDLSSSSIRIRKSSTNRIGCLSSRSIQEIEGGCVYQSQRGLYVAKDGMKPVELSDIIEPYYTEVTNLDLTKVNCINDAINERLYFYTPNTTEANSQIVVFDYYFKEWYLHDSIIASNGLQIVNDRDIYHADATNLYVWSNNLLDTTYAIDSYYTSGWWHFGFPSILKKFVNFVLHSLGSVDWTPQIRTYRNFDESVVDSDFEMTVDSTKRIDDHEVNVAQTKAMSFEIRNNKKNQDFLMTGYEFEYERSQTKPKGEE